MKALVGAFTQEKAFSVIVKTGCGTDGALHSTSFDIDICSPTIQPICINSLAGADLTGETMTVVGWGRTSDGGPRARYLR